MDKNLRSHVLLLREISMGIVTIKYFRFPCVNCVGFKFGELLVNTFAALVNSKPPPLCWWRFVNWQQCRTGSFAS